MFFIKEPGDTISDGLVNFDKLRKLSRGVRSIVQMTASSFDLTLMRDVPTSHSIIFTTFGCSHSSFLSIKKAYGRDEPSSLAVGLTSKLNMKPDHIKRLFEEAVMVRKVRHYLNNVSRAIEKNEERLRIISTTLESNSVSSNNNNYNSANNSTLNNVYNSSLLSNQNRNSINLRQKIPSPNSSLGGSVSSINGLLNTSLSNNGSFLTTSNPTTQVICTGSAANYNTSLKTTIFGTHSPDAVKKLMALSENTKITKLTNNNKNTLHTHHHQNNLSFVTAATSSSSSLLSANVTTRKMCINQVATISSTSINANNNNNQVNTSGISIGTTNSNQSGMNNTSLTASSPKSITSPKINNSSKPPVSSTAKCSIELTATNESTSIRLKQQANNANNQQQSSQISTFTHHYKTVVNHAIHVDGDSGRASMTSNNEPDQTSSPSSIQTSKITSNKQIYSLNNTSIYKYLYF